MEAKSFDQLVGEEIEAAAQLKECAKCSSQFEEEIRLLKSKSPEPWDREQTIFEDGKQAGIKEVVEWIESHGESTCMDCACAYNFNKRDWQAFLKSKGIER